MGFLDFVHLRISAPLHKHDWKVIDIDPLFPIIDGRQELRITSKCKICGDIETTLNYGILMPKLRPLDYIGSFGSKYCITNYGITLK